MTHPVVARRLAERAALIDVARRWAASLDEALGVVAVVVVGSVARGDFNRWSDLDVLVIAERLPASTRQRLEVLMAASPIGLQPVGWTPVELAHRARRRDPLAVEAYGAGVVVWGVLPPPGAPVAPA